MLDDLDAAALAQASASLAAAWAARATRPRWTSPPPRRRFRLESAAALCGRWPAIQVRPIPLNRTLCP